MQRISIKENGIYMVWEIDGEGCLKLLHFSALPLCEEEIDGECADVAFRFIELSLAGFDRPHERHGNKYIVTAPGYRMKYVSHRDERNEQGRILCFTLRDELTDVYCQTAHCGRRKPHFDFGGNTSPIVPYRHLPQTLRGLTADCRSLV